MPVFVVTALTQVSCFVAGIKFACFCIGDAGSTGGLFNGSGQCGDERAGD